MWQVQFGCAIIQLLMSRLDEQTTHSDSGTTVKTCIVGVLSEIVHVAAEGSIGNCLSVFTLLPAVN